MDSFKTIYRNISIQNKTDNFKDLMFAEHFLCRLLSKPCSVWFIKHNITPNQVTLLMIVFGILGSILFLCPWVACKITGYFLWILWFTMDLSDGQVARYTINFSKYGAEMDYMAHLIDHPCMNIALWITFLSFNLINPIILSLIFIVSISMEMVTRNIIAFRHYRDVKSGGHTTDISTFKYFMTQIILYPNLIIVFTPIIIIDCFLNIGFSLYLYIIWFCYSFLMTIRLIFKQLLEFYRG